MLAKLRMAGEHQVINAVMKEFTMFSCNFNPKRRLETRRNIIHPFTASLAGSTPEDKGLHVEVNDFLMKLLAFFNYDIFEIIFRKSLTLFISANDIKHSVMCITCNN